MVSCRRLLIGIRTAGKNACATICYKLSPFGVAPGAVAANGSDHVGQDGILRRIDNPPSPCAK
jgi:hypothetical protein